MEMEMPSAAALAGARLLGEIEETSLDEILHALRIAVNPDAPINKLRHPKSYPVPGLDDLVHRNFRATKSAPLAVTGRQLPLVYALVSTLLSHPHNKTVLIIDTEYRFDATRLLCDPDDLRHAYVHRPARRSTTANSRSGGSGSGSGSGGGAGIGIGAEQTRELVAAAENWMLYGGHHSGAREWWGTIVIGALGAGDVTAAWKGWLRVDREYVPGFSLGCSATEAVKDRRQRQEAVGAAPWAASSQWGSFTFTESHSSTTTPKSRDPRDLKRVTGTDR
ncbi:hypothetical protein BDP55DRAFT_174527 [Colletotrichum godetiae]|uniref:Uncharacterized protein n=1 Tax=Colletotrichum godetiae TaxID=1209918 RepID=A0AAJ0ETB2_9PEZI|nr:uncharacterized protein BDP55DRAFT_174527 [Colletotrichum godetiae]KAK1674842.1 hypothetical protein BDP55DRAFT_174527 [Colletotrichum godetiae]